MKGKVVRSLLWSPTIALSWLWGLGFFYAIHVTLTNGWLGFVCFAAPNAIGLFTFGWVLGSPKRDPAAIMKNVASRYSTLFLLCQIFAVAITMFGFVAYLWRPLFGTNPAAMLGVLVLVGCVVGHAVSLRTLRILHLVYLVLGVAAAALAWIGLHSSIQAPPISFASFDGRFFGLLTPIVIGFLLGPWTDIQHWARAVEIRRAGGSIRAAYGLGAVLFLGLLTLNAILAAAAGPAGLAIPADGIPGAQPAVAVALAHLGNGVASYAFLVWATIAAVSTIDSCYNATRWHLTALTARSVSPLLAFIPAGLVSSPHWIMLAAAMTAVAMFAINTSMIYLMAPFATLLAGSAASLALEAIGFRGRYDAVFAYMLGLAASLVMLHGYVESIPAFETIAPLIALIGALPMLAQGGDRAGKKSSERDVLDAVGAPTSRPALEFFSASGPAGHGFERDWFVYRVTPTYDDTNSVGNIYFANYMRWVGKARELFFNACMPRFELKTTSYFVLTRSFTHDFRREAREFEPVVVRIKIAAHNRKFVTLAHEIFTDNMDLLGSGEQTLMFVDSSDFRLLDIPRAIIEGFLPHWPKNSPHVATSREPAPA